MNDHHLETAESDEEKRRRKFRASFRGFAAIAHCHRGLNDDLEFGPPDGHYTGQTIRKRPIPDSRWIKVNGFEVRQATHDFRCFMQEQGIDAPGTIDRIQIYAERVANGDEIFQQGDAGFVPEINIPDNSLTTKATVQRLTRLRSILLGNVRVEIDWLELGLKG